MRRFFLFRQIPDSYRAIANVSLADARHQLFQLAHVTGVPSSQEMVPHAIVKRRQFLALAKLRKEVPSQRQDIIGPLRQRW